MCATRVYGKNISVEYRVIMYISATIAVTILLFIGHCLATSLYRQIASYQRGMGDHVIGR